MSCPCGHEPLDNDDSECFWCQVEYMVHLFTKEEGGEDNTAIT